VIFMATTNTAAAKQAGKAAAKSPKVAKVVVEETTKVGVSELVKKVNGQNVLILAVGVGATLAVNRLRGLYLATKAKADNTDTPNEGHRESIA